MKLNSLWKFMAALGLIVGASLVSVAQTSSATSPVKDQKDSKDQKKDEAVAMEKMTVTGSYLPLAANSVAVPVISLDSTVLMNSGNNNDVLEILRKTAPEFTGNSNLGSSNANISSGSTQGGSSASLRNASTLVLINGRRMAYSPASATGGYQFVDLNLIPVAAIERIEVLADGASAIYGSDAVSGVVNIILKTNYEGVEAGGRYGWATSKGHQAQRSGYIVGGSSNGKTSLTFSAEWLKVDPIFNYERPYSETSYGTTSFAGSLNIKGTTSFYYLSSSLNAPTVTSGGLPAATLVSNGTYSGPRTTSQQTNLFNLSQYVTQGLQNERQSFSLAFEHKISDSLNGFGDVLYSHTSTFSQINAQPITYNIGAGLYGNPFDVTVTARNRLTDHPRQYFYDTHSARGVAGLSGKLPVDWSWEAAATYNRIDQNYKNPGVINYTNLVNAITSGAFNMFARKQADGVVENYGIVGTATGGFVSTLSNLDLKFTGKAFELPAGSLDLAIGGELRKEGLSAVADPLSQLDPITGELGWTGATTLYPFDANRRVSALFAEVRVPVFKGVSGAHLLEFTGAFRKEYYSDTSNPDVPKLTFRYLPINDEFALRGTYSKSFSAPQLYSLFGPVSVGYTDSLTLTKIDGTVLTDVQTNSMSGANAALKPSTSKNYTIGVVYSPKAVKGLSLSLDYWKIKQNDLVGSIPSETILQDVETKGTASQYASYVHFNSFTGPTVTGRGQIGTATPDDIYLINYSVNIAETKFDGFDFAAKYDFDLQGVGHLGLSSNIGTYNHYTHVDYPGEAEQETVGKSTEYNGTIPRWQAYTTIEYTRDNYTAVVGWRSIPSVTDDVDYQKVGSYNSFDLSFSYKFGREIEYLDRTQLTIGVNNVFNKYGPEDSTVFSDANVDIATYGSWGRFVYVDLKYKF